MNIFEERVSLFIQMLFVELDILSCKGNNCFCFSRPAWNGFPPHLAGQWVAPTLTWTLVFIPKPTGIKKDKQSAQSQLLL